MCLFTKMQAPLVATRDIVCYKYVKVKEHCFKPFYYSNTGIEYKYGKTYFEKNFKYNGPEWWSLSFCEPRRIVNEGFHSYSSFGDICRRYLADYNEFPEYQIIKCVIPKGGSYYISEDRQYYCSDKIKICNPDVNIFKFFFSKYILKYKTNIKRLYDKGRDISRSRNTP